ncbi:MAG: hypothetical protein ACK4S4_10850 [Pyrinomonadaceae bacterium]
MKRWILWDYERGTWQYDIFCLMIIAFIFLTPKEWFDGREKLATRPQTAAVKTEQPTRLQLRQAEINTHDK